VKYHYKQGVFFVNSSNFFTTIIYNNIFKVKEFFELREENKMLIEELVKQKNNKLLNDEVNLSYQSDTLRKKQYVYISGKVIKNTIHNSNNYITINRGSIDGIEKDMGVANSKGVIGIVTNVSTHFCVVLSVLNSLNSIGCKLKNTNYFGSVQWNGKDYRKLILEEIPNHVEVKKGDTVVTSGYGAIFPEGIMIGTVDTLWKNFENNFFTIQVNTSVDLKRINHVYLIKNILQKEQLFIEEQAKDNNK
jgi:rod shape-determining protein MreC